MDSKTVESCNLRRRLGFNICDVINSKQQTVLGVIKMNLKEKIWYRINLYFHDYKLTLEVDEFGHSDRNIDYEMERQKAIEKELGCKFIRINHDAKDYNIYKAMNKMQRHTE